MLLWHWWKDVVSNLNAGQRLQQEQQQAAGEQQRSEREQAGAEADTDEPATMRRSSRAKRPPEQHQAMQPPQATGRQRTRHGA